MFEAVFYGLFGTIALGVAGIVLLIFTAEYVVDKLLRIADYFGVSDTFMGLTVLSIGTSLPEISSHLVASGGILLGALDYKIASSTVLGANIGSDVVQQTFVLGVVVFLVGALTFTKDFLLKSYSVMVGTHLLTLILAWDGTLSRLDGFVLLVSFLVYMAFLYREEKDGKEKKAPNHNGNIVLVILLALVGLLVLFLSSLLVLQTTEHVVEMTGLGGSLIGVMTLGVASALPEMFTAVMGVRKKAMGISVGTLIGSNITNPLFAIGIGALVSGYFVPEPLIYWDLPMETITALLLFVWLLFRGRRLRRLGATYLILLYVVYVAVRIIFFAVD